MWTAGTSPLFSFQFPRISTPYFTGKLGQMLMWGEFQLPCEWVCVREWRRGRHSVCQSDFVSFFITNAKGRQIKKLYSNWYDQAEHLNQISNIKIRQSTRLGNKTGPFSSILCLICCEWAGAGCAPPGARCTIWRAELSKDGARAHEWEKHGTLFLRWPARVAPPVLSDHSGPQKNIKKS